MSNHLLVCAHGSKKTAHLIAACNYGDLLLATVPFIKTLLEQAAFPVDFVVTDADDKILIDLQLLGPEDVATRRDEKLPAIRWPVTVTATDHTGREWNQTFAGPTIQ